MDLHFTGASATEEERRAVDSVLGPPDSAWRGGERSERDLRMAVGGREQREQRHLLLPALHAVQGRIGWISPGALNYVCERLMTPPAEAYGVATFYALFSTTPQPPTTLHICDDAVCRTRGAEALCAALEDEFASEGEPCGGAIWKRSPCLGLCERAPAALVQRASESYEDFTIAPADSESLKGALGGVTSGARSPGGVVPQSGAPGLRLLRDLTDGGPESLDDYRASGGYSALRRAMELGAAGVIREVSESRLTGRGGAAFPTGVKWKAVAEQPARPHYLVCNADESETGTFKDRVLMEGNPYALLEAMSIAGFACGAELGYLYIRGEYPEATRRLQRAIDELRERGLLGQDILGKGLRFDVELRRGAGAYICGEETALLNSIEGKRGEPRNKPPFPVQRGLFGKPTAINNVETLLNVLDIVRDGGEAYAAIGTAASTGTRLFCLSGCVERPGVYELAYGATLGEAIALAGGVWQGRTLQAVLLGGAAGVFIGPEALDMPLTLDGARAANATLGSGVILVLDDTVALGPILLRIAAFFRDESCGQCVPCRVGTVRQEEILRRMAAGMGENRDQELALLAELDQVMRDASICGLGHTASSAIRSAIARFGDQVVG